ncbi:MAG: GNAT family N-acetyltransferase [Myxococcales bacterium]|nr:GNAT family N-acetyltransferase [Myxococcales bacterium]
MTAQIHLLTRATRALFTAPAAHPGWTVVEDDELLTAFAPSGSPLLNYVLRAEPAGDPAALVARTLAMAGPRGLVWKVAPTDRGAEGVARALLDRGLVELPSSTPIWGPIPEDVETIVATLQPATDVRDGSAYRRWCVPFARAFHVPEADVELLVEAAVARGFADDDPIQHVLVERDGEPVACGTLVVDPSGLAGAFNVAVDPQHRREGLGTAVLGALALRARRAGCTEIGQFSTPEGMPLYDPHGRAHPSALRNFLWMGGNHG